jgi:hypothetical protein
MLKNVWKTLFTFHNFKNNLGVISGKVWHAPQYMDFSWGLIIFVTKELIDIIFRHCLISYAIPWNSVVPDLFVWYNLLTFYFITVIKLLKWMFLPGILQQCSDIKDRKEMFPYLNLSASYSHLTLTTLTILVMLDTTETNANYIYYLLLYTFVRDTL